ncbi:DotI/IcmL/TraM family protein [Gluconacetobacter diazotrophicus]|uniref:DotI/IcmL/TraM family protein n=1 Tax=Gluconacetobacter diazotrophicus TaxID=33996 RepID=A0A7W4I5L0_GLUDI|nr:DotI/IcmL/TraM family protein [Gluconacetobacter diazotrophicus]MBB2156635.1 DotI/IcmL/TraM family protein [Gluconacetobacter diazotrophicus]
MRNFDAAVRRRLLDPEFLQAIIKWGFLAFAGVVSLCMALGVALIVTITHAPHVRYIANDLWGRPHELIVTDKPYFTSAQVMNWAVQKVTGLYTIDFVHWAQELNSAEQSFAVPAWNEWARSFQEPGNIDFIKNKRVFTTAVPKSAPSIVSEGPTANGDYEWHVTFPMYLKWENESGSRTDLLSVNVTIKRTNDPLHAEGLEITELNTPRLSE